MLNDLFRGGLQGSKFEIEELKNNVFQKKLSTMQSGRQFLQSNHWQNYVFNFMG